MKKIALMAFAVFALAVAAVAKENKGVLTVINPLTASIMGIIFAHGKFKGEKNLFAKVNSTFYSPKRHKIRRARACSNHIKDSALFHIYFFSKASFDSGET